MPLLAPSLGSLARSMEVACGISGCGPFSREVARSVCLLIRLLIRLPVRACLRSLALWRLLWPVFSCGLALARSFARLNCSCGRALGSLAHLLARAGVPLLARSMEVAVARFLVRARARLLVRLLDSIAR